MPIIDSFIQELNFESISTRKTLERVPEADINWQPHPKSMTMGGLASHIAEIPGWVKMTLETPEWKLERSKMQPWIGKSSAEIVATFDKNVAEALEALKKGTDQSLMENWSLVIDGQAAFSMPRAGVLRSFIFNHMIHHRAQLGVYLRLRDIPVPMIYGPSADER